MRVFCCRNSGLGNFGLVVSRATYANPVAKVVAVYDPLMPLGYMVNEHQYDSVHGRFKAPAH